MSRKNQEYVRKYTVSGDLTKILKAIEQIIRGGHDKYV